MISFLKDSKRLLNLPEKLCFVLGNESCDLDSAVSAIALAFFYTNVNPVLPTVPTKFLPLLNIPRKQFLIKTEVSYFLQKYNILDEFLIFKDDSSEDLFTKNSLILVDHHVSPYRESVIEVYDHRPLDSSANLPKSCKTTIEQVGSCATLIGDLILRSTKTDDEFKIVLQLLYGAIVMDTVNFSPVACRTTELDLKVAGEIETVLKITDPTVHRESLFAELVKAREDVSLLTAYQLLFKDMKLVSSPNGSVKVGIPGYPISVQEFIKKSDAKDAVTAFAKELNCSVVLLIGMKIINGSDVSRDIGLININNKPLFDEILLKVKKHDKPNLELSEHLSNGDFLTGRFFQQGNIRATRKHILPIVKEILEEK